MTVTYNNTRLSDLLSLINIVIYRQISNLEIIMERQPRYISRAAH